ncbi:putative copper-transporting ATPase HMA5 [Paramyrothecium foliicola]|nr:putative copper-transporting ATPase HMA5 [Paramyrothecium foliicola]
MAPAGVVTASYLLGNLHCPSCVAVIKSLLLETYPDQVVWVSPNLVTSVVTVEYRAGTVASLRGIKDTLEDAGFEVCGVRTTASCSNDLDHPSLAEAGRSTGSLGLGDGATGSLFRLWKSRRSPAALEESGAVHMANCTACQGAGSPEAGSISVETKKLSQLANVSQTPVPVGREDQASFDGTVVDDGSAQASWRAVLSVGGMTCAVCTNTITEELQKNSWVSKAVVNLVANAATVDFTDGGRAQDIVEAIEDLGYDATLNETVDLRQQRQSPDEREVEAEIEGIFCARCPDRICETLKSFGYSSLEVLRSPTVEYPILKLRYTPKSPEFTIRHILRAIEAADSSLKASIYHPPTLEERSRMIRAKHQRELLWREIMTLIIGIPTFVFGIAYMSLVPDSNSTKHHLMKPWKSGLSRLDVILCVLATPVYFFAADVFHVRAIKEIRSMWRPGSRMPLLARFYKFGSMNMLMSLGTSIAYISSVVQMIVVAASQKELASNGQFYFDSVVFLTLFLLAGRLIEAYTKSKTGDAVEALAKLRPTTALLVQKEGEASQAVTTISVDVLEHGDIIKVPNGSSPPADGIIVSGKSSFDESSLTGESRLVQKVEGDQIFSGTVNKAAAVTVRVTGASGKSMLDQIVEVVREGQTKRAPIEQIADIMVTYFVPIITLIAVVTWAIWMAVSLSNNVPGQDFPSSAAAVAFAFQFAIAVFVIACPCGLALAAPTAIFVGGGLAAKYGVLVKGGGEAFEKASKIDCVVFDKTGTLTIGGAPQVTDSVILPEDTIGNLEKSSLLAVVRAVEENSTHPIAKAVVDYCSTSSGAVELEQVDEVPGRGMKAICNKFALDVVVGNELLVHDVSAEIPTHVQSSLEAWKREAKSIALVAIRLRDSPRWRLAAALSISDPIRPESASVVKALQSQGTQVWMLSGDNATTAQAVAQLVGIPSANVLAEVLPSEKADKVKYLQSTLRAQSGGHEHSTRRAMVAMVGDGINDSPALTTADVGIAIGSGSDVAISSADFVLATSRLSAVLLLVELSRAVLRRIRLNFGWAVVYNLLAVPVAAGCLYAIRTPGGSHVTLDPVWASLAMALSSISVVLSSLSLRTKLPLVGFRHSQVDVC